MKKFSSGKVAMYVAGLVLLSPLVLFFWFFTNFKNGSPSVGKVVDGRGISASILLPQYTIFEYDSNSEKLCSLHVNAVLWIDAEYEYYAILEPPAGVTFQGKPVGQGTGAINYAELPCLHGLVEFVVTDYHGAKRVDKYNLRRAKVESTTISTTKSQDLHIKLIEVAYPNNVSKISVNIVDAEKMNYRFKIDNSSTYPTELSIEKYYYSGGQEVELTGKDRPRFDASTQTLIIPARILQYLKGKTAKIELEINTVLPGSLRISSGYLPPSFDYNYSMPPVMLKLK
jgi:hypothetical protein